MIEELPQKKHPKNSESLETLKQDEDVTKELVEQMDRALESDIISNQNGKPAFQRLMMLKKIDTTLQRIKIHEDFLEKDGCHRLALWLQKMPDDTYPNQKIILQILKCIDRLPITPEHLKEGGDLEGCIQIYREGDPGSGYKECQALAKIITNKFNKQKYGIRTDYDKQGRFEDNWRVLQRQIEGNKYEEAPQLVHDDEEDPEIQPPRKR